MYPPRGYPSGTDGPGSWRGTPGGTAGGTRMPNQGAPVGGAKRPLQKGPWEPSVTNLIGLIVVEMILFGLIRHFFRKMGG